MRCHRGCRATPRTTPRNDTQVSFATPALTCAMTPNDTLMTPDQPSRDTHSTPPVKRGVVSVERFEPYGVMDE